MNGVMEEGGVRWRKVWSCGGTAEVRSHGIWRRV